MDISKLIKEKNQIYNIFAFYKITLNLHHCKGRCKSVTVCNKSALHAKACANC